MRQASRLALPLVLFALVFAGCTQGPGHTRAAGTVAGTAAGAVLGAALSPCNRGAGAAWGAALGMMAGSMAGDGVAQDQEASGCYPCAQPCDPCPTPCRRCDDCQPRRVPRTVVVRRRGPCNGGPGQPVIVVPEGVDEVIIVEE